MQTTAEQLQDLKDTIKNFEAHLQEGKASPASLGKAQDYLDGLEKHFPPKDPSTNQHVLFHMYEMQALLDTAKGNVRRAKAFVGEALDLKSGQHFVSETVDELRGTTGNASGDGIPFFVVSAWRYIGFAVLTFGVYSIYWFYKQWKAIEVTTGRKQHPVLSAIFAKFFSYNFFLDLKNTIEARGGTATFSPVWRAIAYFLFGPLALIGINAPMEEAGGIRQKGFTPGETAMLVLGVIFWGLMIIGAVTEDRDLANERHNFIVSCQSEANRSDVLSSADADNYCTCVYDHGITTFGHDEFIDKATDLGRTSYLTTEMSDLVNECLHEVDAI